MWGKIAKLFLDLLAPSRCVYCGKLGFYFCPVCLGKIEILEVQKCPVCEREAVGGATHPVCRKKYSLDGLFSLFKYEEVIRAAVLKLKYQRLTAIESELARLLNVVLEKLDEEELLAELEDFIFFDRPVVVPIPLHWLRRLQRRFNQAELVGRLIINEYGLVMAADLLTRPKYTQPQTQLKGKIRNLNMRGAFAVNKEYLIPSSPSARSSPKLAKELRNILLVDDVVTTGATLAAAANSLKRRGARKVWGLTLAA